VLLLRTYADRRNGPMVIVFGGVWALTVPTVALLLAAA